MSASGDKLAQSRLAIIEHIHRKEHGGKRRRAEGAEADLAQQDPASQASRSGWFNRVTHAGRIWWRHHPAHMALELATPSLSSYARRRPAVFIGAAMAIGAAAVLARPWKVISLTGLLVALAKSSQLSSLVMSAMSAADYRDDDSPEQ